MGSNTMHAPAAILLWGTLVALVLFLRTLRSAMQRCAPVSRTMTPEKVWLVLIPFFGLLWQFVVVVNLAKSLGNEFARLGISRSDARGSRAIGLASCVCNCCLFLPSPVLRGLVVVVGFILWMAYWAGISNCSRLLETHQGVTEASSMA